MLRKEQFAFGAALVASALAVILSQSLAWFILIIGLGFVFDFYVRDLIWGTDRLAREEIEKMDAEEYKARVLGNRKTESWVNWLASGRDAFNKQMRKLAREAVIFTLVTPVLVFAGSFGYLYHDAHKQVAASTTKEPYGLEVAPGWTPLPCKDGESYAEHGKIIWTCQNGVRKTSATEEDWVDVTPDLTPHPQAITQTSPSNTELLEMALRLAFFGIPVGFGLWVLYRALIFAVKG